MNESVNESTEPRSFYHPLKWTLFLGLSRTPHGILDVATPAMAALLWLGHFPSPGVVIVGLITAFAGYTAVYALNDIVDFRIDKERLALKEDTVEPFDVDALTLRYPLAQGVLSISSALVWCIIWGLVALAGAWWLNPVCAAIFVVSALMEMLYCKLLRVTHLKIIPSAIVKASGGIAGVYAVDPDPSFAFVSLLFLWLAAWEIGGQNIANDLIDLEADDRVGARTTVTVKGVPESVFRVVVAVSIAAFTGLAIYWFAGTGLGPVYPIGAVVLGWLLLLQPARTLYYAPGPVASARLFNRASYMPVSFLVLIVLSMFLPI